MRTSVSVAPVPEYKQKSCVCTVSAVGKSCVKEESVTLAV
jgi:hypothetical protein